MKKFILTILFFFSLFSTAIAQQTATPITEQQAIEIAEQEAIQTKIRSLDWFGGHVNSRFDGNKWIIIFSGKPNSEGLVAIGDQFMVYVSSDGQILDITLGH